MVTKRQGVLLALWLALALILRFVCTACDYLAYSIVFGIPVRGVQQMAAVEGRAMDIGCNQKLHKGSSLSGATPSRMRSAPVSGRSCPGASVASSVTPPMAVRFK